VRPFVIAGKQMQSLTVDHVAVRGAGFARRAARRAAATRGDAQRADRPAAARRREASRPRARSGPAAPGPADERGQRRGAPLLCLYPGVWPPRDSGNGAGAPKMLAPADEIRH